MAALVLAGCSAAASPGASDPVASDAQAPDAGADGYVAAAQDDAGADVSQTSEASVEAGEAQDGGAEASCKVPPTVGCIYNYASEIPVIAGPGQYCAIAINGAWAKSLPFPAECAGCDETETCACLMAHLDGGAICPQCVEPQPGYMELICD